MILIIGAGYRATTRLVALRSSVVAQASQRPTLLFLTTTPQSATACAE
jgi:hypothetical protein